MAIRAFAVAWALLLTTGVLGLARHKKGATHETHRKVHKKHGITQHSVVKSHAAIQHDLEQGDDGEDEGFKPFDPLKGNIGSVSFAGGEGIADHMFPGMDDLVMGHSSMLGEAPVTTDFKPRDPNSLQGEKYQKSLNTMPFQPKFECFAGKKSTCHLHAGSVPVRFDNKADPKNPKPVYVDFPCYHHVLMRMAQAPWPKPEVMRDYRTDDFQLRTITFLKDMILGPQPNLYLEGEGARFKGAQKSLEEMFDLLTTDTRPLFTVVQVNTGVTRSDIFFAIESVNGEFRIYQGSFTESYGIADWLLVKQGLTEPEITRMSLKTLRQKIMELDPEAYVDEQMYECEKEQCREWLRSRMNNEDDADEDKLTTSEKEELKTPFGRAKYSFGGGKLLYNDTMIAYRNNLRMFLGGICMTQNPPASFFFSAMALFGESTGFLRSSMCHMTYTTYEYDPSVCHDRSVLMEQNKYATSASEYRNYGFSYDEEERGRTYANYRFGD